ncbi:MULTISPECIES: SDR family NAD(P)-dependent oxidoreductase [Micromonospora]|uniref:NAD(P)-dependent dehydrogenase, short-chain alcohol dehydrogenase family n=1 Tax=Micromonospora yangpuensis TaxID=683228 RepID=A0A1C6UMR2_9ACTN|nr:SDR family NAD(P)-dependent oxidoreductase [Micromonospora yangpuensis]GGM28116.1 3-hydroxy-2-methylbutyryl-CoA dehydrogenase [Micromonospora yangpuensis]SCL55335.1 NAD(P)-dependent dehydrogenase, short-chain alcohol dehydrogenase family [Micromonospora yangpuensis]
MDLARTVAIVTGAASGLGAATAAALAARGATVHGFDLGPAVAAAEAPPGVRYVEVDVTDAAAVRAAVADAAAGDDPLRTVVNCAGIAPSQRILGKRGSHDLDLYATVVRVNLIGTFTVLTLAAEAIARTAPDRHGQRGVIVNTASVAGYEGQIGQAAYASSKGGVLALTLPAARDLAPHGIRVMTVAPGIMQTPMMETVSQEYRDGLAAGVPFPSRFGTTGEYADLVLAIIGNDYLNGEVIRLDGALRMAPR